MVTAGMEAIMNRQSNKITAIYTRIDYPGNSECIQRQEQALRKYAEKMGLPNLAFYSDDGYNGADPGRPYFQRLLNDIKQGKVENIVVHSLDRLYRDYMSISQLIDELLPKWQINLYSLRDHITPQSPHLLVTKHLRDEMGGWL